MSVIYWYHRQFIETAQARYLAEPKQRLAYHLALVEYYEGKWAGRS